MLSGVNPAGPAARAKSRRSKLVDRTRMRQLIQQTPEQLTTTIADSGYKNEIDMYAGRFHGAELIEAALTHNLAKELRTVLGFCRGNIRREVGVFADKFAYENAKIVLRAVANDIDIEEVVHSVLPEENETNKIWIDMIRNCNNVSEATEAMKNYPWYRTLSNISAEAPLSEYENALDFHYYAYALKAIGGGDSSMRVLRSYLKTVIDHRNVLKILEADELGIPVEVREGVLIPGGSMISRRNISSASNYDVENLVELMKRSPRFDAAGFDEAMTQSRQLHTLDPVVIWLKKNEQTVLDRMCYLHPLSSLPIIHYLSAKVREVQDLRLIVRGREAGLEPELLEKYIL